MIAIVPTENGWYLRQEENELGYYRSLPEAMHVAYAADFLKFAREVRAGSKRQRRISREAQRNAWKKNADPPAWW